MPADTHTVHLVLCRLRSVEDVGWAASIASESTQVFVYNSGAPLQLPQEMATKITERMLSSGGHESYCYLEHILRSRRGGGFAAATVFAPAMPRCKLYGASLLCTKRVLEVVRALASAKARLEPNGFAPIEASPVNSFWHGLPRTLSCLTTTYSHLSKGRDLHSDSDLMSFSPMGAFAVTRANLLSVPRGWLQRAQEAMRNSTASSPRLHRCCEEDRTCVPWLLERLWPMLLNTPHRGCNGVRTGYCANEWNMERVGKDGYKASHTEPPVGTGAIKLRLDVARVGRVARFTNDLTDDERTKFMELLAAERHRRHGGGRGDYDATCTTQLCAILALLDKARAKDEADFELYLAASVNKSDAVVRAHPTAASPTNQPLRAP